LHGFRTNDFIGGAPQPPFWRRRVPWFDVLLFVLLIAALVAVVHAVGSRFEIGQ
jgi:hypothetical protein